MDNQFFSSGEIYAQLASSFPRKVAEISIISVAQWCGDLMANILRDPVSKIPNKNVQLGNEVNGVFTIVDNKVLLPNDLYKLDSVFNENHNLIIDYLHSGAYIYFSDLHSPKEVYIDYYSIPVDDMGFPLIKRGYELASFAYCVYKMFEEDATCIPPKIAQWRWMEIQQNKDWEIEAAMRSFDSFTNNDFIEIYNYLIGPDYALYFKSPEFMKKRDIFNNNTSNIH